MFLSVKKTMMPANGERYLRVGGRRSRHFAGARSKPRKLPENAATPTRRVHAVLGSPSTDPQPHVSISLASSFLSQLVALYVEFLSVHFLRHWYLCDPHSHVRHAHIFMEIVLCHEVHLIDPDFLPELIPVPDGHA